MQIITHSLTVNSHAEGSHTEKPLLFVNKAQTDYSSRKLAQHYHNETSVCCHAFHLKIRLVKK